ncbi:hypothetical protein NP493_685g01030 [Ridgeia piscesae]|uniref:G-protein coupled receptors family 1 profile domain-containing protein n=1 Tax=Ridgeia piscesae TaxID=27915 RepID=A0AAD9NN26_RIDPI|nr:hypothetical protein NP493_685g01030 [Ridgeia piscesae]
MSLSPGVSIAASVLTIVALSLDRYVAVLHPVKSRSFSTKSHIRNTIFLIWAIACTIMLPLLAVQTVTLEILPSGHAFAYCYENWNSVYGRRIFDCFLFVFIYVIPGSVVIVSYSLTGRHLVVSRTLQRNNSLAGHSSRIMEGRRRVARMLLMLAALFAISWLPYHSTVIYMNFSGSGNGDSSMTVLSFALLLGHWHSAQNPVLYCITNANFWRATVAILKCRTLQKQGMQKTTSMRRGRLAHSWTKSTAGRNGSTDTTVGLVVTSYKETTTTSLVRSDDGNRQTTQNRRTRSGLLRRRGGDKHMVMFTIGEASNSGVIL